MFIEEQKRILLKRFSNNSFKAIELIRKEKYTLEDVRR